MTPLTFADHYLGRYVRAPGGLGRQCVDLANLYLVSVHGLPPYQENAVDWRAWHAVGWTWVDNQPLNWPKLGSIVVWRPDGLYGIGQYGHIAISLCADSLHMVTLDQDWPYGAPVNLQLHHYGAVMGWWQY